VNKLVMLLMVFPLIMAGCLPKKEATAGGVKMPYARKPVFIDRGFIDHYNLRYLYSLIGEDGSVDLDELKRQVEEIKKNMDKAVEYGMTSYTVFSRSFEYFINYDFLGEYSVFPKDHPHRKQAEIFGKALREVIDYAHDRNLRVIFHTNQFEFPQEIYDIFGYDLAGTAPVCPGKSITWKLYKGKIAEFFNLFPECDGLQITTSECQVKVLACNCPACQDLSSAQRIALMANNAWEVCREFGKELQLRTWGGLDNKEIYNEMTSLINKNVIISTKNTHGDFCLINPISPVMGEGRLEQVIEFDAWREYTGWNRFPCYMGDIYAERMRIAADKGVKRVAIRLNWSPGINYIFGKPWGNVVNVYLFSRLARDPYQDADTLLMDFIKQTYPEKAHALAFRLYKLSTKAQIASLTFGGTNCNDHSRVFKPRGSYKTYYERIKRLVGEENLERIISSPQLIDEREKEINRLWDEIEELLDEMKPYINERYCALLITECLRVYRLMGLLERGATIDPALLEPIKERILALQEKWRSHDAQDYETMFGEDALKALQELEQSIKKGAKGE